MHIDDFRRMENTYDAMGTLAPDICSPGFSFMHGVTFAAQYPEFAAEISEMLQREDKTAPWGEVVSALEDLLVVFKRCIQVGGLN